MDYSLNYFQSEQQFIGKNIIITGATGGIGSILVETLVKLKANVLAVGRTETKLTSKFLSIIKSLNFKYSTCNFEESKEITKAFRTMLVKLDGKLDILIICHSIFSSASFKDCQIKDFDKIINVNVRSIFHMISLAVPFLKVTKGNIVVLSSLEAIIPNNFGFLNSISKSMVNSLIECSALELASFGIRVNGVAPAITNTEHRCNEVFNSKDNQEYLEKSSTLFLLKKQPVDPEEIADSVLFLASSDAEFVTGEIIKNDNGYALNHDLSFNEEDNN